MTNNVSKRPCLRLRDLSYEGVIKCSYQLCEAHECNSEQRGVQCPAVKDGYVTSGSCEALEESFLII
jgi:hypothetical protein